MRIQSSPIPIKERHSILFIERGKLDVKDGAFVLIDKNKTRLLIPVGNVTCLMLEPGIRISHAAVGLAAEVGCLLIWVGEAGVRLYSAGQPGGARSGKLLHQARLALDPSLKLQVVRKMYKFRFGCESPARRSLEQLRGIEGNRVKQLYKIFARENRVPWKGRIYDPKNWEAGDYANRAISVATHCLYGLCEAAILAAGYAPAIGFIHVGKARSFVYDIADLFKFDLIIPLAFKIAAKRPKNLSKEVRIACREAFRQYKFLKKIIPAIEEVLNLEEVEPIKEKAVVEVAIYDEEGIGDVGHRN